jgi:hypothetical protein
MRYIKRASIAKTEYARGRKYPILMLKEDIKRTKTRDGTLHNHATNTKRAAMPTPTDPPPPPQCNVWDYNGWFGIIDWFSTLYMAYSFVLNTF